MDERSEQTAERLAAILESAVDGILAIDEFGTIESVNSAAVRLFGYDREELVGANVNLLMPSPDRERHDQYIKNYLQRGVPKIIGVGREVTGRRKDGATFPLYLAVSEALDGERKVFTGIVRDLSDLRLAEERARSAEQLASLSVITAGIAHDIGTPMNVILGYADMLRDSLENPKDQRRAEVISDQVRRVTDLLQTLMNIARPRKSAKAPVRIREVLEHALDFFQEKLRTRGIAVDRQFDAEAAEALVLGDRDRLEQMLLNLIVNASDAMSSGGQLTASLVVNKHRRLEILIQDTGHGIAAAELDRIFEPFYSSKERGKGTGLGLVVSQSIVLEHEGTIHVESDLGKGTRFLIEFPIHEG